MFVRTKIIDGKKRRYLVKSYRDKETGKPCQRHIAYIDLWSENDVARLMKMHKQYQEALANAERPDATKVFKKNAVEALKDIENFKRAVSMNVKRERNYVDGRRLDLATGQRRKQFVALGTPDIYFRRAINNAELQLRQWIIKEPIESWSKESRLAVKTELRWLQDLYKKLEE
jgi:hypothetical protein